MDFIPQKGDRVSLQHLPQVLAPFRRAEDG